MPAGLTLIRNPGIRFLLRGGLEWLVHFQAPPKHFQPDFFFAGVWNGLSTFKPRRSTFGPISSSRGFGLACPLSNPAEAFPARFLLRGGLDLLRRESICCMKEIGPQSCEFEIDSFKLCRGLQANP